MKENSNLKREAARLRRSLQPLRRLERNYEALRVSFAHSERIRRQQKEHIRMLQRKFALTVDLASNPVREQMEEEDDPPAEGYHASSISSLRSNARGETWANLGLAPRGSHSAGGARPLGSRTEHPDEDTASQDPHGQGDIEGDDTMNTSSAWVQEYAQEALRQDFEFRTSARRKREESLRFSSRSSTREFMGRGKHSRVGTDANNGYHMRDSTRSSVSTDAWLTLLGSGGGSTGRGRAAQPPSPFDASSRNEAVYNDEERRMQRSQLEIEGKEGREVHHGRTSNGRPRRRKLGNKPLRGIVPGRAMEEGERHRRRRRRRKEDGRRGGGAVGRRKKMTTTARRGRKNKPTTKVRMRQTSCW